MSIIEPEDIAKLEEKKLISEQFQVEQVEIIAVEKGKEKPSESWWAVSLIKDPSQYCFEVRNKDVAENLCDFLNNECYFDMDTAIDQFVLDNCVEWSNLITDLSATEAQLYTKKEQYEHESEKLLEDAAKLLEETEEDIIKAKYGGNNDKTRKKYVKDTLLNRSLEIKQIEFKISYYKRRISYLKSLVRVKTAIMEAKSLRP